ncbi:hypothetical protein phytr_11270 [Candidatus Phycorickettsia trachydisci]|uniref:Uncharacterized protein n=1 Tax=Candidatus Phycorickettsia trachydisci TaxID=2115978 RepID=A0A2P1P9U1_9RICK|nr:ankyrin repeat domain-containing protein [Candidatus Phycorickettsia trachydisci]AVP88052.1 hypothetical protein phytr_11270 [Candidatus Phycorickettsia trachydisci]
MTPEETDIFNSIIEDCKEILPFLEENKEVLHFSPLRMKKIIALEGFSDDYKDYYKIGKAFKDLDIALFNAKYKLLQKDQVNYIGSINPFAHLTQWIKSCEPKLKEFFTLKQSQNPNYFRYRSNLDEIESAIREKDIDLVRELLEEDESLIYRCNVDECCPIHFCAKEGNAEIMKMLIEEFGGDVNSKSGDFYTPLHLAAKKGNISCLIELLKHGADTSQTNVIGKDVIDFLAENNDHLKYVLSLAPDEATFELQYKDGDLKIVGDRGIKISEHIFVELSDS